MERYMHDLPTAEEYKASSETISFWYNTSCHLYVKLNPLKTSREYTRAGVYGKCAF